MKGKERERIRTLSKAELDSELRQASEKYFQLRFKHRATPLSNPLELRTLRRRIAFLKTRLSKEAGTP